MSKKEKDELQAQVEAAKKAAEAFIRKAGAIVWDV